MTAIKSPYLTRPEAAAYIRCSLGTLKKLIRQKEISTIRVTRKKVLVTVAELDRFMTEKGGAR
jgi:excisionase family DNA binding protein